MQPHLSSSFNHSNAYIVFSLICLCVCLLLSSSLSHSAKEQVRKKRNLKKSLQALCNIKSQPEGEETLFLPVLDQLGRRTSCFSRLDMKWTRPRPGWESLRSLNESHLTPLSPAHSSGRAGCARPAPLGSTGAKHHKCHIEAVATNKLFKKRRSLYRILPRSFAFILDFARFDRPVLLPPVAPLLLMPTWLHKAVSSGSYLAKTQRSEPIVASQTPPKSPAIP